jgi:flagellar biogenesis protein FliO
MQNGTITAALPQLTIDAAGSMIGALPPAQPSAKKPEEIAPQPKKTRLAKATSSKLSKAKRTAQPAEVLTRCFSEAEPIAPKNETELEPEFTAIPVDAEELCPSRAQEALCQPEPGQIPDFLSQSMLTATDGTGLAATVQLLGKSALGLVGKTWSYLFERLKSQQDKKRLRVCETVSLGEKRFIAVIQVDGDQFLVGGSASSVSTLAHLEPPRAFSEALRRSYEQGNRQA